MYNKKSVLLSDVDYRILSIVRLYEGQKISVRKKIKEMLETNDNLVDRHLNHLVEKKYLFRNPKKKVRTDIGHMIPTLELTELGRQQLEILDKIF